MLDVLILYFYIDFLFIKDVAKAPCDEHKGDGIEARGSLGRPGDGLATIVDEAMHGHWVATSIGAKAHCAKGDSQHRAH